MTGANTYTPKHTLNNTYALILSVAACLHIVDSNIRLNNKPHFIISPSLLSYCRFRSHSRVKSQAVLHAFK